MRRLHCEVGKCSWKITAPLSERADGRDAVRALGAVSRLARGPGGDAPATAMFAIVALPTDQHSLSPRSDQCAELALAR